MANNTWQLAMAKAYAQYKKDLEDEKKRFNEELTHNIEHIYSAMLIVMHRHGYTTEQCEDLINEVGELWNEVAEDPNINIKELCFQETGMKIREEGHLSEEDYEEVESESDCD